MQEAELAARRLKYYNENERGLPRRVANIYIFNTEDLDNDSIIDAVESTPTTRRQRTQLEDIINLSKGVVKKDQAAEDKAQASNVISFV